MEPEDWDDTAEIDTTEAEFEAMWAEAEPAVLIDPPSNFSGNFWYEPGAGIRIANRTTASVVNCRLIPKAVT